MSILSDRQIMERCVAPRFLISYGPGNHAVQPSWLNAQEIHSHNADKDATDHRRINIERQYDETEREALKPMISPFFEYQMRTRVRGLSDSEQVAEIINDRANLGEPILEKVISYGLSSYGYDVRCSNHFKIFTNINSTVIDPKNFHEKNFVDVYAGDDGSVIIPPNSFALAVTMEYFRIPRDVLVVCLGKSTYARCGIVVNVTPLEPEWEGQVTLEFSNTTPLPAKIYAGEGCAQMLFFKGDRPCEVSYNDRNGKYQGQTGVQVPRA